VKNRSQAAKVVFLKTKLQKLSFWFLNFEVSSVHFIFENWHPTFSTGSAHP